MEKIVLSLNSENKLSREAQQIIKSGGYRNEDFGVGSYFSITEVVNFEINELLNSDIVSTCRKLYNKGPFEILEERFNDLSKVYGLWVTTKDGLKNYTYDSYGDDPLICKYDIPEDYLILSDLSDQGILIATEKYPGELIIQKGA